MHSTDDLTTRSAVMVARAALQQAVCLAAQASPYTKFQSAMVAANKAFREYEAIRDLSASDAALARAIDTVPGRE